MRTETTPRHFEASGLRALIRAGERGSWFGGHFGAALLAGAGLLDNANLPPAARHALAARLSRLEAEHGDWFEPLGADAAPRADTAPLWTALAARVHRLRTSGHGTIYLVAALRALDARPELATQRCVHALLALHEAAQNDNADRYLGCDDYFAVADSAPLTAHRPTDLQAAIGNAFRTCARLTPDIERAGRHHYLFGEKIHVLTHTHALLGLVHLGRGDLALAGLRAQAVQVALGEVPDDEHRRPPARSPLTPAAAAFWETDGSDVWHKIKLAEAVSALLPLLPPDERAAARRSVAGMWSLLGMAPARRAKCASPS